MTGKEFKQFVSDQGWSNDEAVKFLGISRRTLFRQYRSDEVNRTIAIICELMERG